MKRDIKTGYSNSAVKPQLKKMAQGGGLGQQSLNTVHKPLRLPISTLGIAINIARKKAGNLAKNVRVDNTAIGALIGKNSTGLMSKERALMIQILLGMHANHGYQNNEQGQNPLAKLLMQQQ
ncbi:MAG: hypothetical protein HRU29_12070 [Rhizobiales bacterium]|nr:hypothetical protein [Hyphomicrobiales bacterium]NRB15124.1 hypothetical protein [Hyphomicrobiales bacterium]